MSARHATAAFAVLYLGQLGQGNVRVATIRKWASLGMIARAGRDAHGRVLYDLDTVTRYARRIGRIDVEAC